MNSLCGSEGNSRVRHGVQLYALLGRILSRSRSRVVPDSRGCLTRKGWACRGLGIFYVAVGVIMSVVRCSEASNANHKTRIWQRHGAIGVRNLPRVGDTDTRLVASLLHLSSQSCCVSRDASSYSQHFFYLVRVRVGSRPIIPHGCQCALPDTAPIRNNVSIRVGLRGDRS